MWFGFGGSRRWGKSNCELQKLFVFLLLFKYEYTFKLLEYYILSRNVQSIQKRRCSSNNYKVYFLLLINIMRNVIIVKVRMKIETPGVFMTGKQSRSKHFNI